MKEIDVSTLKHPNEFALVDDDDYEWLNQWKWSLGTHGYACRYEHNILSNGKKRKIHILMHRLVNKTPTGLLTDHINSTLISTQPRR